MIYSRWPNYLGIKIWYSTPITANFKSGQIQIQGGNPILKTVKTTCGWGGWGEVKAPPEINSRIDLYMYMYVY